MEGSAEQSEKALSSILVTLLGIVTLVRFLQSWNRFPGMEVTPLGSETFSRCMHPSKAADSRVRTLLGTVYSFCSFHMG